MKAWMTARWALLTLAVVWLCAACAQGGAPEAGGSGITMYGTIDQGVTFKK